MPTGDSCRTTASAAAGTTGTSTRTGTTTTRSRTNRLFVEWKNTSLPNLSGRLKYTYFQRRSDFLLGNAGVDANDPAFLERFTSRFDLSSVDRNEVKLIGDWSPMPLLDFSLEATWKDNNYKDITLGRTSDRREDIYLSASWGDPSKVRITGFGDYERITYDSNHRNVGVGSCDSKTGPNCFDPSAPPSSSSFNWSARTTGTTTGSSASAPTGRRPSA